MGTLTAPLDSAQGGLGYKGKQNGGVPRAKWSG